MKPGDMFRVETIVPCEGEYTLVALHTFEGRQYVATVFASGEIEIDSMVGRAVMFAIERAKEKAHAD